MKKIKYLLLTKSVGFYINFLSFVNPKKATLIAYKLFSEPRIGKLSKDNLPEILKETEKEILLHNDQHFQTYTWKGNNTIILLIHGWESNASRWEQLLPYLKKTGNTIVAIDAPAHGLSAGTEFNVPLYAAYIDIAVQKFKPNYLIGHSIGGAASIFYQSHYKNDSVEKMVLLGAPSDLKVLIQNYVNLLSMNSKMNELLEQHFSNKFQIDAALFSAKLFGEKLNIKGLIAHDENDTVVAFAEGEKIADGWKNASFITTKGLGHSLHDDDLYQKIVSFLETEEN